MLTNDVVSFEQQGHGSATFKAKSAQFHRKQICHYYFCLPSQEKLI